MFYRWISLFGLIVLFVSSAIFGLSACSSAPDTVDDEVVEVELRMDAAAAFDAALPWLPKRSQLVAVGAGQTAWETLGDNLLATSNPHATPGAVGTTEGLRSDVEALLVQTFGFDPAQSYAVVIGADSRELAASAVIFGEFEEPTGLHAVDVEGTSVYEIDLGMHLDGTPPVYARAIDEPRRGLVLALSPDFLVKDECSMYHL